MSTPAAAVIPHHRADGPDAAATIDARAPGWWLGARPRHQVDGPVATLTPGQIHAGKLDDRPPVVSLTSTGTLCGRPLVPPITTGPPSRRRRAVPPAEIALQGRPGRRTSDRHAVEREILACEPVA